MTDCPKCGATVADGKSFCSDCGTPLSLSSHPTIDSPKDSLPPVADPSSKRFHPGQIFGARYRIVAPLGRGGMGEVYRAEDLKLGQTVAIKLLPRNLENDEGLLERLHNEVRLALKVTHPSVCRVFDIGDVDGRHFLSMEYVDGEDLASLLRRIGRLPHDKALDVARNVCAGLAAAHDQGVLHRDLKPANIMIDGRGRAKITDFGLAGATSGIEGAEAMAGTPGYLAPEQLEGKELTVATDIYALGILLYELFTGERAFTGDTLAEILSQQRSGTPTSSSTQTKAMEPAVEQVVARCMEANPTERPASALAVAAALPGGDPLAAALAAGETPSPEMVAEAGGEGTLRPAVAISLLALVLAGLALVPFLPSDNLVDSIPLAKPPAELRMIARNLAAEVGYADAPVDQDSGYARDREYFEYAENASDSPDRWDDLDTVRPSPLYFWYRESPAYLVPLSSDRIVQQGDPPMQTSGMVSIRLDQQGRLLAFMAVPPQLQDEPGDPGEPNWHPLFDAAGLDRTEFEISPPIWTSTVASDMRQAWVSLASADSGADLKIEAAAFQGKPVFFKVIPSWRTPSRMVNPEAEVWAVPVVIAYTILIAVIASSVLLARRNRRLGRTDGKGALRLALVFFAVIVLGGVFEGHLRPTPTSITLLFNAVAWGVFWAALIWAFYDALEPYVRRLWPDALIGWSRLLDGRFRDPLVGKQILFGAVASLGSMCIFVGDGLILDWLGVAASAPSSSVDDLATSATWSQAATVVLGDGLEAFLFPIWGILLLVLLRVVVRFNWLASVIFVVGLAALTLSGGNVAGVPFLVGFTWGLIFWAWAWFLLTRFGLLVMMMNILFQAWSAYAAGADIGAWYFPRAGFLLVLLACLAIYGFFTSLGSQKLFRDVLSE